MARKGRPWRQIYAFTEASQINEQLLTAYANNDIAEARECIRKGADVNSRDDLGRTPLMIISSQQKPDMLMASLLIKSGTDVNVKDKGKYSELAYAAGRGHMDIIRLLIRGKADLNVIDCINGTALSAAAGDGHDDIVTILKDAGTELL